MTQNTENKRLICFYLPQYHPIPENDKWWGKGFTEWTNVTKCRPRFEGHYQPHLPADLGFYDLRLAESRAAQASLAREYGIHGFCYYHYWFSGKQVLNRPFDDVLASGSPELPFCLCWANENWSRRWDGGEHDLLLEQHYSAADDLRHIESLLPALRDPRYIRVDGKALLLIYRAMLLPEPRQTCDLWRDVARRNGVGELYLCCVESFPGERPNPCEIGFDAAVEFAPDWRVAGGPMGKRRRSRILARFSKWRRYLLENNVFQYSRLASAMRAKTLPDYPLIRCVTPMWDNSSRRRTGASVFLGSTPEQYEEWLRDIAGRPAHCGAPELVFINAWNEWAEGCHLEPCQKYGHAYLKATRDAMSHAE